VADSDLYNLLTIGRVEPLLNNKLPHPVNHLIWPLRTSELNALPFPVTNDIRDSDPTAWIPGSLRRSWLWLIFSPLEAADSIVSHVFVIAYSNDEPIDASRHEGSAGTKS